MASYIITVVYPHLELEADHAMITHTHLELDLPLVQDKA